ncbi:Uncharacterised protein [Phocoenobacter uteri]|uniref:Ribbon-helix-helix protein CopG domain-containing protein n=1 Tax=Phocoenobacter uteri TaxID=146806 RepID=A0A379C9U8_9PAST|nr:hypothetical protein [Phocoenobacter uteri]MDG6881013.1 hypothetical protein [Phocoenobacter uteri]SUB59031.1 Uncharacterised protein [Phocoenobacter uteri]
MTNSTTEHSKKLRAKTAKEHNKKQLEAGIVKRLGLVVPTETLTLFDEIASESGLSRPKALQMLCEFYQKNHR